MRKIFLAVLVVSGVAGAQTKVKVPEQRVDFGDYLQGGERIRPAEVYTLTPKRPSFDNLIRLRANFSPELRASTDNVR